MRRDFIIGIDCGSTATKAVIFSPTGQIMGTGRRRLARHMDRPHHVERDMGEAWLGVAETIRMALADAGLPGQAIAAVGLTAHGDGLFMLDRGGNPLGRGIMSLDSRATALHENWRARGVLDQIMPVTGQRPMSIRPARSLRGYAIMSRSVTMPSVPSCSPRTGSGCA